MWFNPSLLHTEALQRIIRSNRNRLEIELSELLLDIMATMNVDSVSLPYCAVDALTGKGGETPSPKSVAGMLETDPCAKRTDLYHLPVQLQSGVSV